MNKLIFYSGLGSFLSAVIGTVVIVVFFHIAQGQEQVDLTTVAFYLIKHVLLMIISIGVMVLGAGLEVFSQRKG